jgi:arginine decarboxylase-like protein
VLRIFRHDPERMFEAIHEQAREAIREKRLTRAAANEILAEYRESLEGYTYLNFTD